MNTTIGEVKSIEERRVILQQEINKYIKKKYRVINQTDTTAQLLRPKIFSIVWFVLFLGIFYLFYHWLLKKEQQVYIIVDEFGQVAIE